MATLAASTLTPTSDLLPTKKVAQRYAITVRTLERWALDQKLGFPKPALAANGRYFKIEDLEAWEKARAAVQSRRHRLVK